MAKTKTATQAPAKVIRLYSRKKKYWNATQVEARRTELLVFLAEAKTRFPEAFSFEETPHAFCVVIDKCGLKTKPTIIERLKRFFGIF